MQLRSFRVQGFKNFRQPIVLEDLGPVNVIHGPNNVGKSNLLQAIDFFFFLAGLHGEFDKTFRVQATVLAEHGFDRIVNIEKPEIISLEAEISIDSQDFERSGMAPIPLSTDGVLLSFEFAWRGTHGEYTIRRVELERGIDFIDGLNNTNLAHFLSMLNVIAHVYRAEPTREYDRFAIAGVDRRYDSGIALALYDAKESTDFEQSRRWEKFVQGMGEFDDIFGKGTFVAIYQRKQQEAMLVRDTDRARFPLQLLGSGVQKVAALLGMLAISDSTIVGIEEPELNLRFTEQLRLREILEQFIGGPGGLDQIFITSHSDAFETGSHFYYMEPTADGPRVEKRSVDLVRPSLGMTDDARPTPSSAALCYLSSEGVVRVPERIRHVIGLPNGGGVVFFQPERDGNVVEMMSDDTFADRFEPKREEDDGGNA